MVDGSGGWHEGIIQTFDKKNVVVTIQKTIPDYGKRNHRLHIGIAPTKNIERFEWFLEKATEIGIDEITPLLCQRSERTIIKLERLQKILVSAMKQTLKAYLPQLHPLTKFNNFVEESGRLQYTKLIGYLDENQPQHIKNVYQSGKPALVLIGPEGDFTTQEIAFAKTHEFSGISLGNSRLRTETAGVVTCQAINFINDK